MQSTQVELFSKYIYTPPCTYNNNCVVYVVCVHSRDTKSLYIVVPSDVSTFYINIIYRLLRPQVFTTRMFGVRRVNRF